MRYNSYEVGNFLWYCGHTISIFSALPIIIERSYEATVAGFIIATLGQIVTMISRCIERKDRNKPKQQYYQLSDQTSQSLPILPNVDSEV